MQKTIAQDASFSGVGLHTGHDTTVTFKPAEADEGIHFVRTDLPDQPRIKCSVDNIAMEDILRQTAIGRAPNQILTVEHVLGAVAGLGIDNMIIEVNSNEPPVGDGSAMPFVTTILDAGVRVLDKPRRYLSFDEPIWLFENGLELMLIPSNRFEITFKIDYDHPAVGIRSASFLISEEIFCKKIAPARTFCFLKDVEEVRNRGLIKGGSLENAIVIGEEKVLNEGRLRFEDEIIRHKILDLLGDFALLGRPILAHVVAVRSGHAFNAKFLHNIVNNLHKKKLEMTPPLSIETIRNCLPHRYPFLLVDRILELDQENLCAVGLKNVTINEEFFQGHFPVKPVMPGVLLIECMAQVGGMLILSQEENRGKLAYLGSIEQVRFRRQVVPGDQLIIETKIKKLRKRTGLVDCIVRVDGQVAAQATILFALGDE
jgi:UDP-3-O-[3-hydroxymyristoyl] N-acetylglucosamine deacetylase / 3-hydroxyacyl-[acyl-carrier-protein] dehydratase